MDIKPVMSKIQRIFTLVKKGIRILKNDIHSKCIRWPRVLQLPITYLCNFDCVMCGIKDVNNKDLTPQELEKILESKLFKKITSIGVNGGEPFIKNNLLEYICAITAKLPKLKYIYIITNGYFLDNIKEMLPKIKTVCDSKRVKLHIAVSVDAIGEKQDFHRGKKCWDEVEKAIDYLLEGGKNYYDNIDIICTLTKYNVYDLPEVEVWAEAKKLNVDYNIATYHERINNADKYEDFTIFNDKLAKQIAEEFLYQKFRETNSERYFCSYYRIKNKTRVASCQYQSNFGVTLTPNKQLAYCATYSKELGDAFATDANELYRKNIPYKKILVKEKCNSCVHYSYTLNIRGFIAYFIELIKNRFLFH